MLAIGAFLLSGCEREVEKHWKYTSSAEHPEKIHLYYDYSVYLVHEIPIIHKKEALEIVLQHCADHGYANNIYPALLGGERTYCSDYLADHLPGPHTCGTMRVSREYQCIDENTDKDAEYNERKSQANTLCSEKGFYRGVIRIDDEGKIWECKQDDN